MTCGRVRVTAGRDGVPMTTMIELGIPAPEFTLESSAESVSLANFRGQPIVLYFLREFA